MFKLFQTTILQFITRAATINGTAAQIISNKIFQRLKLCLIALLPKWGEIGGT